MSEYNLFKKRTPNHPKGLWYYWYTDPITGRQIQKRCKGCDTKWDAEQYVLHLPPLSGKSGYIKDIGACMYITGSVNVMRREQLGKSVKEQTLLSCREHLRSVIQQFGHLDIRMLTVEKVMNWLILDSHSASWKNQTLAVIKDMYQEAQWNGVRVTVPVFPRFRSSPHKADTFTLSELSMLLRPENFDQEDAYMLFLLTASAGLRISEARAAKPAQLIIDQQMFLVDGFLDKDNRTRYPYCKKGSNEDPKWRLAIMNQDAVNQLSDFIRRCGRKDSDYIFLYHDLPYRMEYLRKIFSKALKKANIAINGRKLTPHSLRYTYVTQMRTMLDVDTVRKMVGHTTQAMTEYYTRDSLETASAGLAPWVDVVNERMPKI